MAKVETLSNVIIKTVDSFHDHRGQLFTLWEKSDFDFLNFNHDKIAISYKNVLRGLHTDKSWKLITCIHGSIQLVVANIDKNSPDYLNHIDIIINSSEKNKLFVLVPPGFVNGHLVLSDEAVFYYKWCYEGEYPDINDQFSVNWADPKLDINWLSNNPILSDRDKKTPLL
jgi:dTDP-4-dehydrorhamnose 3,5-epimerase